MIIAIDFDGTCVTHEYPKVGKKIDAERVLKRLIEAGHQLVLFTMRSGDELKEAVEWFKDNDIKLFGINETPGQKSWTTSPKVYAKLYIDDASLACPLIIDTKQSKRPFVDWKEVEKWLENNGYLQKDDKEEK